MARRRRSVSSVRRLSVVRALLATVLIGPLVACVRDGPTGPGTPTPCAYTIAPTTLNAVAGGGTLTVQVTTTATCAWSAAADRDWVSIATGAIGTGPGAISVHLAPNVVFEERTATLRVASLTETLQVIPIRQAAATAACTWTLVPARVDVGSNGAVGSSELTTPATCPWSARTAEAWIRITSAAQGVGPTVVSWTVARNDGAAPRTGAILVADRVLTIEQAGNVEACVYAVSPVLFTPCMSRRTLVADVATTDACPWTVTTEQSWLVLAGSPARTGSGTITFEVADNWAPPRAGVVVVRWPAVTAGQNIHVQQAGCSYTLSTAALSIAGTGGVAQVSVFQQSDPTTCGGPLQDACLWSATTDAPWLRISTAMPRFGDDTFTLVAEPNPTSQPRTGTVRVADRTLTITQTAGAATSRR